MTAAVLAACGDNYVVPPEPDAAPCVPADPPADDCPAACFHDQRPSLRLDLAVEDLELAAPPAGSTIAVAP